MNVIAKYEARADAVQSLLCVGLDTDVAQLPAAFQRADQPQYAFNRWLIDHTQAYTAAYKINTAFYEARGADGWRELALTIDYLREHYPALLTICDAKRGDIGSTNTAYARAIFDQLGFDAITLHAYTGREALQPFLDRPDKGAIILCRTSNPGAGELQDLEIAGIPLWQIVAETVSRDWNTHHNCMLVVGATYPDEMRQVRSLVGDMTLLVPGIGVQGGDVGQVVEAGLNRAGKGLIITASRSIILADDPAAESHRLQNQINAAVLGIAR